jgi:hypothetical protein
MLNRPVRSGATVVVCAALLTVAALTLAARGSQPPASQPQWFIATFVTASPGMAGEYAEHYKTQVMPAQKKGGSLGVRAWSGGIFGESGRFAFFTPVASMAQFDAPAPTVKALGEEAARALMATGMKMMTSRRTVLLRTRPDLSYNMDMSRTPAPLVLASEVETAPGRRTEFEALLKKEVVPIMQQAKVRSYSVFEVVYGDASGKYITSIGFDSHEAIGKGHPFQVVLGDEGAIKLEAKFTGIVTRLERYVARFREDMSFRAGTSSN